MTDSGRNQALWGGCIELALEVGGPDLVGSVRFERNGSRTRPAPAAPVPAEPAVAIQHVVDRAPGRQAALRLPSLEDPEKLLGAPAVLLPKGQDLALDRFRGSVGVPRGSPGSVFGTLQALSLGG